MKKTKMNKSVLNFCQISLKNNIPIIIENYFELKKLYKNIKIFIVCPEKDFVEFKQKINFDEVSILSEEKIISFEIFKEIYEKNSKDILYKNNFESRLNWYYQQILKISFVLNFIKVKKENIIIWDADTLILKKIDFFFNNSSIYYGTFNEFHNQYFETNKTILNFQEKFHISFLTQFASLTTDEGKLILDTLKLDNYDDKKLYLNLSELILKSIFKTHKIYNGSMFSKYELIGQINYENKLKKQKPILSLRFGLNGKLTNFQKFIAKILNFKHVTYENSHFKKESVGMLERKQTNTYFFFLILKNLIKFRIRNFRFNKKFKKNLLKKT